MNKLVCKMKLFSYLIFFLLTACTHEKAKSDIDFTIYPIVISKKAPVTIQSTISVINLSSGKIDIAYKLINRSSKPVMVYENTMNISSFDYKFSYRGEYIDLDIAVPMDHSLPILETIKPKGYKLSIFNVSNNYPTLAEELKKKKIMLHWVTKIPVFFGGNTTKPTIYQLSGEVLLSE